MGCKQACSVCLYIGGITIHPIALLVTFHARFVEWFPKKYVSSEYVKKPSSPCNILRVMYKMLNDINQSELEKLGRGIKNRMSD